MDIDGQEAERFDIRLAPNPAATIEQEALDVAGVTLEQVQSYQPMEDGYRQLVGILSKYVNKFDKRDKMYLVGYNNAGFDNNFLRALFQQCGDKYFGSWFSPNITNQHIITFVIGHNSCFGESYLRGLFFNNVIGYHLSLLRCFLGFS